MQSDQLSQSTQNHGLRLDACYLTRNLGKTKLLDAVSVSILPSEFVAIMGVSGAGKTTLMNCLNGFRPADAGNVFINVESLYDTYDQHRAELGYVPQDDIIHRDLTVYQALYFSARLRMPPHTSKQDLQRQVQAVLEDLELTDRQQTPVKYLSGGQRKRACIGVELLTRPQMFFLDEATSGLDPGRERQMMQLLRRLADEGRTVVLITHTTKNVMVCDQVVFLTKGGKLAYYGPPQSALEYFEVEDFDEIYLKVQEERSPTEWEQRYRESDAFDTYITQRQRPLDLQKEDQRLKQQRKRRPLSQKLHLRDLWRQFTLLSQRNLTILRQDPASLLLMLLIAPLLGLSDFIILRRETFDAIDGDSGQALTFMFLASLIAVLVGSLATMREIVKESEIYRRERMIGLRVIPYVFSKVWFCVILALYQSAIFLSTKLLLLDWPHLNHAIALSIFFTLFLCTFGGMLMGLVVSALSTSQNVAPLLIILFLVPQISFAGALFPLEQLGSVGNFMSHFTFTRWSYEALVTLSGMGQDIAHDPCWQTPQAERDNWTESDKENCQCLGPHLFERCYFPALKKEYVPEVDQPKPQEPQPLSDPPPFPKTLSGSTASQLEADLNTYQTQVASYRQAFKDWQDRFSEWKEKRGKAISSAEALISRVRKTQGHSFDVNVSRHWAKLIALQAGFLGVLMIIQKRKDIL